MLIRYGRSQTDFSALVNLPPGPHRLKFIVDKQWKTSRNLPSATDQDGQSDSVSMSKADVESRQFDQLSASICARHSERQRSATTSCRTTH